jgi:hypothetical protein
MITLLPVGNPERRLIIGPTRTANICDLADVSDYSVEALEAANPMPNTPPREDRHCRIERYDGCQSTWKVLARAAIEAEIAEYLDLQEGIGACGN